MKSLSTLFRLGALAASLSLSACSWLPFGGESTPEPEAAPQAAEAEKPAEVEEAAKPAAKPDPERDAVCSRYVCRGATTVSLNLAGGENLSRSFDWFSPVVQDGSVTVLPGEELFLEAEVLGGKLAGLKAVERNRNPGRTLVLKFQQVDKGLDMVLTVRNPFAQTLKYQLIADDGAGKLSNSPSCPVKPGDTTYETWEQPVFQAILMDFKLLPMGQKLQCE
ncbi:MAG: hypothetical protein HYV16_12025 [Gammaproteobacteria bacterium]|nr:hypothetical protein [Gammaproteobacteria bacterium]